MSSRIKRKSNRLIFKMNSAGKHRKYEIPVAKFYSNLKVIFMLSIVERRGRLMWMCQCKIMVDRHLQMGA